MFDQRFCIRVNVKASWSMGVHDFVQNSVPERLIYVFRSQKPHTAKRFHPIAQGRVADAHPGILLA